jgi:hypothetical protein
MDKHKAEAIAHARAEIAKRISRFCHNLSSEQFEALLDRMAGIQAKYDILPNLPPPTRKDNKPQQRD